MKGVKLSPGIGFGVAHHVCKISYEVEEEFCSDSESELLRLEKAIAASKSQLENLKNLTKKKQGKEEAQIFDAHILILEDPAFLKKVKSNITDKQFSAPYAYHVESSKVIAQFRAIEDPYLQERSVDIEDISKRVIRNLKGIEDFTLSDIKKDTILVARDLTPSETASIDPKYIKGIVTETAGKTSHSAIMARTLEIPAIGGINDIFNTFPQGEFLAVDGTCGRVHLNPDHEKIEELKVRQEKLRFEKSELQKFVGQKTITMDNHQVYTYANIGQEGNIDLLEKNDAEGVGLFRSEFLYMQTDKAPSEESQFRIYKKAVTSLKGKPLILRTLDIGGDKNISYLHMPKEENPFLGQRAIRYCFENVPLFKVQLRAALRASAFGPLKIMFPMIACLDDYRKAKNILIECKKELTEKKIDFNPDIQVGIMIEIPSAAYGSDLLAEEADFFSIGTNDLIQYMMAADRNNERVANFYSHFEPSVLRIIHLVIKNGQKAGISVGMCGSMAADPLLTEVLLGMGLHSFSMEPTAILRTRKNIHNLSFSLAQKERDKVLAMKTSNEIKNYLIKKGEFNEIS